MLSNDLRVPALAPSMNGKRHDTVKVIFPQHPDKVACIFKQAANATLNKRLRV
jgi:hypothetical protein